MKPEATKIKICGIKDPEMAYNTAQLGADYVGLMLYPKSRRAVNLEQAVDIASAVKQGGAKPVAVFVDADIETILDVCTVADIEYVQLHGDISRKASLNLPETIHRIYVLHIASNGCVLNDDKSNINKLKSEQDFLLFDGLEGGSGKKIEINNIDNYSELRFFLAGGLDSDNVVAAINKYKPFVVDVSSGVESKPGIKDQLLIKKFIEKVKCQK